MTQQGKGRRWRPSALGIVLMVLVACCVTVGALRVAAGRLGPHGGLRAGRTFAPDGWLLAAVTSRAFLSYALVTLLAATAMVLLGGLLWRAGAHRTVRPGGQEGQAILEFVMVLPIGLMLVLVMVQSSLLMVGHICVHYAAYCAARSAVVSIPADLSPTEPPNFVTDDPTASGKMRRIHLAAVWAVMPVSCSSRDAPEGDASTVMSGLDSLFSQYGKESPSWIRDHLGRKLQYAENHTRVSLSPPEEKDTYKEHEDIVVTVRHTFYMAVPYAGKLFAVLSSEGGVELDFPPGEYGMEMTTTCRLTNEGVQDWVEAEKFPRPTDASDPPEFGPWYDPWKDWQHGN